MNASAVAPANSPGSVRFASEVFARAQVLLPRASRRLISADLRAMFEELALRAHHDRGLRGVVSVLLFSLADLFRQSRRERREPPAFSVSPPPPRRRSQPLSSLRTDIRHALVSLSKSPAYTLVVLATLAMGIGANTAMFSLVNGVLITPLGYQDADRIVVFWGTDNGVEEEGGTLAYLNFIDVREASDAFETAAAYDEWRASITGTGEPERVAGATVNVQYFDVFGIQPAAGRFFAPEEDRDGQDRVVVLSHALWTRKFGRDPAAVGSTMTLNGNPHTVVGVAPADFEDPLLSGMSWRDPQIWRPLGYEGVALEDQPSRGSDSYIAIGRLRDGVTLEAAAAEVDALMAGLVTEYPEQNSPGEGMKLIPIRETMVRESRPSLMLLLGAVALLLTIAAVYVASLMMSRAADRSRETAVRLALGASRIRLLQLNLVEGLLLALGGGTLGVLTAYALQGVLLGLAGSALPRTAQVSIDLTVLGFTALESLLAGVICGLAPLGRALRTDPQSALRAGGRTGGTAEDSLTRRALVVGEVALAVVLLVGAMLLIRSFAALEDVDLGMQTDGALVFDITLPYASYSEVADHAAFYQELSDRLATVPGVVAMGTTHVLPLGRSFDSMGAYAADQPEPNAHGGSSPQTRTVMPGYLEAMGMRLAAGRWFTETDTAETEFVVVINETFAEELWPGQDPLGRQIITWRQEPLRVIGVVRDLKHMSPDESPTTAMYVSLPQGIMYWHGGRANVVVRATVPPLSLVDAARDAVKAIDPNLPASDFRTMDTVLADNIRAPRFRALLIGMFAFTALLLAALGVYGVVAFHVARHLRNVAIRVALGADRSRVIRHVLATGLAPVALGTVLGLVGAFMTARAIETLLFNTTPLDPVSFGAVPAVLLSVAALASWLPARRAARVDPMSTLRDD